MKHHLKHMAIGATVILVVLLALRVDIKTALQYALLLACPLGMIAMMVFMGRKGHAVHDDNAHEHMPVSLTESATGDATVVPRTSAHDRRPVQRAPLTGDDHERLR